MKFHAFFTIFGLCLNAQVNTHPCDCPSEPIIDVSPKCITDDDCDDILACEEQHCVSPCVYGHPCGLDAFCHVRKHQAVCRCPDGFIGDPVVECQPSKYTYVNIGFLTCCVLAHSLNFHQVALYICHENVKRKKGIIQSILWHVLLSTIYFLLPWNEPVPSWYSTGCRLKLFAILAGSRTHITFPLQTHAPVRKHLDHLHLRPIKSDVNQSYGILQTVAPDELHISSNEIDPLVWLMK